MQAQTEYFKKGSYSSIFKDVYAKEGIRGLYRGSIPPIMGSIVYRSSQFAIVDIVQAKIEKYPSMKYKIPFTGDLEPRLIVGGLAAAQVRSILECPFEFAKIKRQTG